MPAMARIYVSYAREDTEWCRAFVEALRWQGADVWHAERSGGPVQNYGGLPDEAERELRSRPVFIVVLSPAALVALRAKLEIALAVQLATDQPARAVLAVMADQCTLPPPLHPFPYVSGPEDTGVIPAEAAARIREALDAAEAEQEPVAMTAFASAAQAWERAKRLRAAGQPEQALALCERALAVDPLYAPAWCGKGDLLRERERYDEAIAAYDHALANDVLLAAAWYGKGQALNKLKLRYEALQAYERALGLEPRWPQAWIDKGDVLAHLQRYDEAIQAYEQALAIEPQRANVWNRIGNTFLIWAQYEEAAGAGKSADKPGGVKFSSFRRGEQALEAYNRALALDPTYAHAWSNKILLLERLGRLREAAEARRARDEALRGGS
jgi:tetratricopeptide (TPR) repeat protein